MDSTKIRITAKGDLSAASSDLFHDSQRPAYGRQFLSPMNRFLRQAPVFTARTLVTEPVGVTHCPARRRAKLIGSRRAATPEMTLFPREHSPQSCTERDQGGIQPPVGNKTWLAPAPRQHVPASPRQAGDYGQADEPIRILPSRARWGRRHSPLASANLPLSRANAGAGGDILPARRPRPRPTGKQNLDRLERRRSSPAEHRPVLAAHRPPINCANTGQIEY